MNKSNFIYKTYRIQEDQRTILFDYSSIHSSGSHDFTESITFPCKLTDSPSLRNALASLHLALGISYYKIFVNESIEHPYEFDTAKADFWNEVFINGLGEFLYVNKLDIGKLAKFTPQDGIPTSLDTQQGQYSNKAVMGIGGGKDSILAGELLKSIKLPTEGFVMATGEQLGQSQKVAKVMNVDLLAAKRNLDQGLIKAQETSGAYKGHVPISLMFGLVGCVIAISQRSKYVVVANESSASIPRATWQGRDVNHQWSKSFEFEQMFQEYIHSYIDVNVTYFSAIRPLSSVAIVKKFARFKDYLQVFTSDNSVFKIDPANRPSSRWSLESPKSLSSFMLMSPWLTEEELIATFERNFMNEASLEKLLYELVGFRGHQPLDCVGTEEELTLSINLAYQQGKLQDTALMQKLIENNLVSEDFDTSSELITALRPSLEHAIPQELFSSLKSELTPTGQILESITNKDVVFVGVGQGRSLVGVEEYIRSKTDIRSFASVDRPTPESSLDFLANYDQSNTVFIKNEGIPGREMPVPYITPIQIFFDEVALRGNTTIGITGTKGKSTTASLIYHILKTNNKDAMLVGNIGKSALASLESSNPDTIFVVELSSYQLSDLHISPNISVCTNLFNDHANWHGSTEKYWKDKMNIIKHSSNTDYFIYDPDYTELTNWASRTKATPKPINRNHLPDLSNSKLFGDHNKINALLAITAAEVLGINTEQALEALNSFEPLEHRMQYIGTKNGVIFINDAIGMTPESTIASIKAISQKYGPIGCIMLGGQDRGYNFNELIDTVAKAKIPNIVLFPDTTETLKSLLNKYPDYQPNILETKDMTEAVIFAYDSTEKDHVVLLSTGAPSYSVWTDFEQKGQLFKQAYSKIAAT